MAAMVSRINIGGNTPLGLAILNILVVALLVLFCVGIVASPILAVLFLLAASSPRGQENGSNEDEGQRNFTTTFKELREAAEQGDAFSRFEVGSMYAQGKGVKQDYAEAYFWHSLSGNMMGRGDDARAHLTADQIAEVDKRVRSWRKN